MLAMLSAAPRMTLVACGTAYYACMVAKYWFEQVARIPCEIDVASEFRYREAPLPANGVAIFVSQSGETLDTLEALRYCKRQKQKILSIVNTIESTIERESDMVLHTLAGPEIGVASTKAFTTQITTLACMASPLRAKKANHRSRR
jgi:glucosamine--fructose-6-phosphate aminotransferase (isomerizing)